MAGRRAMSSTRCSESFGLIPKYSARPVRPARLPGMMMAEDEHRPVRPSGKLVEPLQLLGADLPGVPALDDGVENGENHAGERPLLEGLGGEAAPRESVMVAAHVQEPVAEGVEVALQEGFVLSDQARGGEVALDHHGRRVDSRRSPSPPRGSSSPGRAWPLPATSSRRAARAARGTPAACPWWSRSTAAPAAARIGDGVGDVGQRAALGLAEVGVVDGGEPAQELARRPLQRPRLDAVAQHR